jgi:hypothetical protein
LRGALGVHFNRYNLPAWSDKFSEDRCVVTAAYSEIDHSFTGLNLKQTEEESGKARAAAIDEA